MKIQSKILFLICCLLTTTMIYAQSANIYFNKFLMGNPSGGGSVTITLNGDLVTVKFSAGFNEAKIRYNTPIVYTGDLFGVNFSVASFNKDLSFTKSDNTIDTNGISVSIINGWLYLFSKNNTDYLYKGFNEQVQGYIINSRALDEDGFNAISTIGYDIQGAVRSKNKVYYDDLGKSIQSQGLDLKTNKIFAAETRYDKQGRAALQTFSAPIATGSLFYYKEDFMKKSNSLPYTNADFEAAPENPSIVGHQSSSLGWYYSENNSNEPYQDITSYPFSRTIYSELNPGTVLKTIGGNKVDIDNDGIGEWVNGVVFSMPAGDELSRPSAFNDASYKTSDGSRKIIKTISRDVQGIEVVMFTDTDGKSLAAARTGSGPIRPTSVSIGQQGFVDVHVPIGTVGFTIGTVPGITVEVHDLITEQVTSTAVGTLPNGFYRVSITNLGDYDPVANPVTVTSNENYYDYSLNYYDSTGRLTSSKQPLDHLETTYAYNALGQLLSTTSPDEGTANFKYRKDGQIRFSQNSKQMAAGEFSYTNYDVLGRPVESGAAIGSFINLNADAPTFAFSGKKNQHFTVYDMQDIPIGQTAPSRTFMQALTEIGLNDSHYPVKFLSGNVAVSYTLAPETTITWYGYDIYERVAWVVQYIDGLGTKTIDYTYDPVTSAVTGVNFQKHNTSERFGHKYTYDTVDGSLVKVETSVDGGQTYINHAEYKYYETGALKRVELAPLNGVPLQGIDYVYNLNGQLKGINHPSLTAAMDPGGDANDLFGMQIDYNKEDYARPLANIETTTFGQDQYNGNIKAVRWNSNAYHAGTGKETVYDYRYNKNNWLTNANFGTYSKPTSTTATDNVISTSVTNSGGTLSLLASNSIVLKPGFHAKNGSVFSARIVNVDGFTAQNGDYDVNTITYDANGNIKTLKRNKNTESGSNNMDDFTYTYKPGKNQLDHVADAVKSVTNADDLKNQDPNNYIYNAIGQLTENVGEGIKYAYNTSGLVTEIQKNNLTLVKFFYNDKGYRVKKESYTVNGGTSSLASTEYYVRDVSGSVMAIYIGGVATEYPIYGAGRLGMFTRAGNHSVYQLADHLGNVRAVVERVGSTAVAIVTTDYYPFGMPMPGRNVEGNYRYKFQGQEKDLETGMEAFEARLWDARIGRWIAPDPSGQYYSPYLSVGNNPINTIDPDGRFAGRLSAWLYKATNGLWGYKVMENDNRDWIVAGTSNDGGLHIITTAKDSPFHTAGGNVWNNNYMRDFTGDAFSIGGGYAANIFLGADVNGEFTWVLRGKDASFIPNFTLGSAVTVGNGGGITASAFVSKKFYIGNVGEISALDLGGYSAFAEGGIAVGGGGFVGVDASLSPSVRPAWVSVYGGVSAGAEASPLTAVNIKGGVRHNTILFHSNGNMYINNPVEPNKNLTVTPSFNVSYE